MSNNEHSPGPWKIEDRSSWASGGPGDDAHVVDKDDGMVVHIPRGGPAGNDPAAQANARLIVAAPEMLAVLRAVRASISDSLVCNWQPGDDFHESLSDALDAIDATINNATSEEA